MKKRIFSTLLLAALALTSGCASVQVASTEAVGVGQDVYLLSSRGTSRQLLSETVSRAREYCGRQEREYLFVKNIFNYERSLGLDMVSYELYFSCVPAGDRRLRERGGLRQPGAEKERRPVPPRDAAPEKETARPGKGEATEGAEKGVTRMPSPPPAPAKPEKAPPAAEVEAPPPGEKAPAEALPARREEPAAPRPEPARQPSEAEKKVAEELEKAALTSTEEQLRKKNPGPGEAEDLRRDGSPLTGSGTSPIIEEILRN